MENLTFFPLYQTTCFFIPLVAPCTPLLMIKEYNFLKEIADDIAKKATKIYEKHEKSEGGGGELW